MIVGLNRAYGVKEERRWWRILIIAFGLTISLAVLGLIALAAMLYSGRLGTTISHHLGLHAHSVSWRIMQWSVIVMLLFLSFASLYGFSPNLGDQRWEWSTPGAVVATSLGAGCTRLPR